MTISSSDLLALEDAAAPSLAIDLPRAQAAVTELLLALGRDVQDQHLRDQFPL